jgi:hypothetical protein
LYFAGLYWFYALTPYVVIVNMFENMIYISSAFHGFSNRIAQGLALGPELLFTVSIVVGGAYFVDCAIKKRKQPIAMPLYLISLVSFVLHTHIFEFFRMISGAPFILLFGIQTTIRTLSASENPIKSSPFASAAIGISAGWILIVTGSAVFNYPLATGSRLRLADIDSISFAKPRSIEGITFYNSDQQRFYREVRRLCKGKVVINLTSDALIAGACRDNPILVADWLYETSVELAAENPALYGRLASQPPKLEQGEVLFTYGQQGGDLKSIGLLDNEKQDFSSYPINVFVTSDLVGAVAPP